MERVNGEERQCPDMIHFTVPERNDFTDTIFIFGRIQPLARDNKISLVELDVSKGPPPSTNKLAKLVGHCPLPLLVDGPLGAFTIGAGEVGGVTTVAQHYCHHFKITCKSEFFFQLRKI